MDLTESDKKIIAARIKAIALKDLTEQQFDISLTGILFNISVICGCQLPTHEAHINALEKEFGIFLKDNGYSDFTAEEILLAFRMNANFKLNTKIEFYGAVFNIDFAAKVLSQYDGKRNKLDREVSDFFTNKEREDELEREAQVRRVKTKEQFEKYLADENSELDLANVYMQLADDGAFADKRGFEYFFDWSKLNSDTSLSEVIKQMPLKNLLQFDSEKKSVKFFFEKIKKIGVVRLYDENWKLLVSKFEFPKREIVNQIESWDE